MDNPLPPLDLRLEMLAGNLDRARLYGTGLILFVVYRAESARADLERQLLDRIANMGQRVRRIQFRPDEPPEASDLMGRLRDEPPAQDEVVFIYGLRHAFPGLLNSLNYKREFVPDHKWRLLFWALDDEVTRVMRDAPDFWAFVNQTIELPEVPPQWEQERLVEGVVGDSLSDYVELERLAPDERRTRIALRERLLAELSEDSVPQYVRADLHYTLGRLYYHDGQLPQAQQHLESALGLAQEESNFALQSRAKYYLGVVYRARGLHEECIKAYQAALQLDPKYAHPWNGLGNAYEAVGQHTEAITAYQKAIELNPLFTWPWSGLGVVYRSLGRLDDSIAAHEKAIELDPQYARGWSALGNVYRDLGRYDDAITAYQKAVSLDSELAWSYTNLGYVYHTLGNTQAAIKEYEHGIKLAPQDVTPRIRLATIYRELGLETHATEQLTVARTLLSPWERYNWACLEAVAENLDAAFEHLEYVLKQSPGLRYRARHDPALASLHDDPRFEKLVAGVTSKIAEPRV